MSLVNGNGVEKWQTGAESKGRPIRFCRVLLQKKTVFPAHRIICSIQHSFKKVAVDAMHLKSPAKISCQVVQMSRGFQFLAGLKLLFEDNPLPHDDEYRIAFFVMSSHVHPASPAIEHQGGFVSEKNISPSVDLYR
jgi:hypothetical protein